jgi:hypothetical protein
MISTRRLPSASTPFGYNGEVRWVRARIVSEVTAGLALDTVTEWIGRGVFVST